MGVRNSGGICCKTACSRDTECNQSQAAQGTTCPSAMRRRVACRRSQHRARHSTRPKNISPGSRRVVILRCCGEGAGDHCRPPRRYVQRWPGMRRLGERTRDQHREASPLDNKTGRCSVTVPKEYRKRERENEENRSSETLSRLQAWREVATSRDYV